ncbi:MAG: hypothetical protein A3C36_03415 [Omnitrophica WOR_2 bacterium RIFCSPHIGHO2_02_FULL_52_10]|nr:MAG: hypothetical protein A3C36_03415 [Omnitrophica WOR_2 bacterium RIFCSPHIGHO2_02_FULL_52_10]
MRFHDAPLGPFRSEAKLKITRFLLDHEAPMSEREIAAVIGVSHMSVNRAMQEFSGMNLVHYVTVGKAHLWQVNRKSFAYTALQELSAKLKSIPEPLRELKELIRQYLPGSLVERIVLFGSVAKGKEKPQSDIDLFILVKGLKDQQKLESPLEKLSSECLDVFGNRLAPYILTEKQLKEKSDLPVMAEINKGIVIYPEAKV